ncbi:MAG: hypothetical protein GXY58_01360 [Planctomycetaceae bacterium]|nr:hypothetical protein [Planctomycetaceae bacterium]
MTFPGSRGVFTTWQGSGRGDCCAAAAAPAVLRLLMRVWVALLLGICCGGRADAVAGDDDASALRAAFRAPPPACRPLIIMHSSPLGSADALPWLTARRAGGAVIDGGVRPGSSDRGEEPWDNPTYLDDPGQFARLRETIARFREQGLEVWLYDELGYPSCSAGGRVLEGHPEFQVEVVGCRAFRGTAGGTIEIVSEHAQVESCVALPVQGGHATLTGSIDLTDQVVAGGTLAWQAPPGEWLVCLCERFQPDTWRRHNIPRRNVNMLDRRAVARFIELTHDRYATELGQQLADVYAFFTDEPQFGSAEHWGSGAPECVPMVQWCDELRERFRQQTGYSLRSVLPALFHPVGPATGKFRHDFYDVQSDLAAENYFGQLETTCRRLGVASSGHMLLEESLLFHVMFSGSMLKNWARMDLPGVDLLGLTPYHTMGGWNGTTVPVPEDFSCKMASSVAHLMGKQGTFTESFALAETAALRQVLGVAAWQFAGGITHMTTYSVQRALSAEDYAALSDFAGRLACLTRRGRHVADVAVLVPERAVWAAYTPPDGGGFQRYMDRNPEPIEIDRVFRDTCHELLRNQRDFDCLSEELFQRAVVRDGRLHLADESFATLVLPEMRMIQPSTLAQVRTFLESGGNVVWIGTLPCQSPMHGDDSRVTEQVSALLAAYPAQTLHAQQPRALGDVITWIDQRVPRAVRWEGSSSVRLLHRQEPGRDSVLVANPGADSVAGTLTTPHSGNASIWDPETGDIQAIGAVEQGAAVALTVPSESARFLVVEP